MALTALKPIRISSKSSEVFQLLREAILSGELKPGDPLREAHLAKQFHVSQVPVREALLQLEHLGLVVRVPDRGTTVTKLTRSEMVDLLAVRAHLEKMAFTEAAKHLSEETIKRLRKCIEAMETAIRKKNHYAAADADLNFHRIIWAASRNQMLERLLEHLCVSVYAFVSLKRHVANETIQGVVAAHSKLIDVLLEGKSKHIEAALEEHLRPEASIPANVD